MRSRAVRWAVLSLLASAPVAAAAAPPAVGDAMADGSTDVFAVIVTNNRSTDLDRPDLQFADDDGARYYQLFTNVAAAGQVRLLTRLDRATASTHPSLTAIVQPPRRADVLVALQAAQTSVAQARRAGRRTEFYFVFAGHGDVEGGIGYLDLEDGRIDSAFLEQEVVRRVGADVQHIILDSCNSFFVVNPRKPGGQRFSTPKDLALGFASRHPNVGLFLSTNSEAEVYEWSELESGIFSHEVRSGLSGAADVDLDGRVSYAELAGFVDRANIKLPRANLRPQVFQRGPGGEAGAPLFSPARASGRRIVLGSAARRLWIRGASAERLIDLHKEEGPMTVVVPGRLEQPLSIVEWQSADPAGRPLLREYDVPAGTGPVALSVLKAGAASSAARGGAAMFGDLFKVPYGALAYTAFLEEQRTAVEPIFGISAADEARMRHHLTFIAQSDRDVSSGQAVLLGGMGAVFTGVAGALYFSNPRWEGEPAGAALLGGLGLGMIGVGLNLGLSKPLGQKVLESFEGELRSSPGDRGRAVAHIESQLDELARNQRRKARILTGLMAGLSLLTAVATTTDLVEGNEGSRPPAALVFQYGLAAVMAASAWTITRMELPTERLLRLYRTDPQLNPQMKLSFSLMPTPTGLGFSLTGRF